MTGKSIAVKQLLQFCLLTVNIKPLLCHSGKSINNTKLVFQGTDSPYPEVLTLNKEDL